MGVRKLVSLLPLHKYKSPNTSVCNQNKCIFLQEAVLNLEVKSSIMRVVLLYKN